MSMGIQAGRASLRGLAGAAAGALLTSCTPWLERGEFALVTAADITLAQYVVVNSEPVTGKGCFTGRQADDLVFSWAVEDALQQPGAEGATVLLTPTFTNHIEDKGSCLQVTGTPARLRTD